MPLVALAPVFEKPATRHHIASLKEGNSRNPGHASLIGAPHQGITHYCVITKLNVLGYVVFTNI